MHLIESHLLPVGVRLICTGCGSSFWRKHKPKGNRQFCSTACRDRNPFKRPANAQMMEWAKQDMALGLTWYQSARKRHAARSTMRHYFKKLGYVPL